MLCLKCGFTIGDRDLCCRVCTLRAARNGAIEAQRVFVGRILADTIDLKLARPGQSGEYHVQLFNVERQAYCGEELRYNQRLRATYTKALKLSVCSACLGVLDSLIAAEKNR